MAIDYNRQYVGARYVPKFFDNPDGSWDWAAGFQYEPLTMVKYGENTYTSKKLVPSTVGSPNLNLEYWANTGNYNGAIANIQSQIDIINDNINAINTIYNNRATYSSRVFLLIGDSYAAAANSWMALLKTFLENKGATVLTTAQGGYGWVSYTTLTYLSLYENISPKNSITDIIICGGNNDMDASTTSLSAAFSLFYQTVRQKSPLANIYYGNIGNSITPADRVKLASKNNFYTYNLSLYGIKLIPYSFNFLHRKSLFDSTQFHPTEAGSAQIYLYLKNWLLTGNPQINDSFSDGNATFIIENDHYTIINFQFASKIPATGKDLWLQLTDSSFDYFLPTNKEIFLPLEMNVGMNSYMGTARLNNQGIYVRSHQDIAESDNANFTKNQYIILDSNYF